MCWVGVGVLVGIVRQHLQVRRVFAFREWSLFRNWKIEFSHVGTVLMPDRFSLCVITGWAIDLDGRVVLHWNVIKAWMNPARSCQSGL